MNPLRVRGTALGVLMGACGGHADPRQVADWTVGDSAGVAIVANHTDGAARGCVTMASEPEVTIPSSPAGPPLFRVRGGVLLDDGGIVILKAGSHQLLSFDAAGRFGNAVGRRGSGPGEFTDPRWLGRGDGDTLFVWDQGLMRLSVFDGAGALLTVHQVRVGDGQVKPITIAGRFTDGSFHYSPGPLVFFDGPPGIRRFPETHGRYDMGAGAATPVVDGMGGEVVLDPGKPIYDLPFGKEDIAVAHGDVLVIGDNGTTRLRYYDLGGRLRRAVTWEDRPMPVTARDRRAYWERFTRVFPKAKELAATADRAATEHPRFTALMSDRVGWLWVRANRTGRESQRRPWLVLDGDGVLRCSVEPPADGFSALWIGATRMLGWRLGPDDEEIVVLHALARER